MILLPCSPSFLRHDRFSLTDIETDEPIPFWSILQRILQPVAQSTSELLDVLNTISVILGEYSESDLVFLRHFLNQNHWDLKIFFEQTWPRCVAIALEMPTLFPAGHLESLSREKSRQDFTARQIACLVIHQFLCTLPRLPWIASGEEDNSQDLHIWYGSAQPHPNAVIAYFTALFVFFECTVNDVAPHSVTLTLHTAPQTPQPEPSTLFTPIEIIQLDMPAVTTELLGLPSGACVISANKHIGFGRTASQEEMHVGCTPESLPAKLITPPLKDSEVLVVRGCAATVEMTGYGRGAALRRIIPGEKEEPNDWGQRTMLFMDALPLDGYDAAVETPDLLAGNVDRELTKAYTAFASYRELGLSAFDPVITGHWGCGAFGGNREIKSLIQWCAASMAGVPLKFVCEKDSFATDFARLTTTALFARWTVSSVLDILRSMDATDHDRRSVFRKISRILGST